MNAKGAWSKGVNRVRLGMRDDLISEEGQRKLLVLWFDGADKAGSSALSSKRRSCEWDLAGGWKTYKELELRKEGIVERAMQGEGKCGEMGE